MGAAALVAYLAILFVRAWLSVRYAVSQATKEDKTNELKNEITILQPILGGDPCLQATLEENLARAEPLMRFIWLVDEDDEPGRIAAEAAAVVAPDLVTIQSCPPAAQNVNPKTSKLHLGLENVVTPFVAVLDDDTVIDASHLGTALGQLDDCDLYTGLPCYRCGTTLWSSLVAHFVNNSAAITYLPLLGFMPPLTINGMFYVTRAASLREKGGFESIQDRLCDDYAVAKLVSNNGGKLKQGVAVQHIQTHVDSLADYFRLMLRWFIFADQLVRDQSFKFQLLLIMMLGLPPFFLWVGMCAVCGGIWGIAGLVGALLLRHAVIRWTHHRVYQGLTDFNCCYSLLAELLQPIFWLLSMGRKTITWRTRKIRLLADGRFEYLEAGEPCG